MMFTSAISEVSPVSDLASGKMIAAGEIIRTVLLNLLVFPFLLIALAAFVLRRKTK